MVTVNELLRPNARVQPFQVIDWKAERSVSQIVKPLAGTRLLSPGKTYVLVGLTRDFGQSLCTLFVQQGARHIVLCSRNPPKTQPKWQTEMLSKGITVRFEALDVTSLERVVAFKSKLAQTLPPVGGVVNGAMVLEDRVFSQMSLETLHRVMKPKTVGSANLDAVFDSPDMDFFIMTSSFAAIGGHAGQSNYAAANMYMNGLAASRRRRGLPGSVVNIGVIYGLGFLHREKDDLYEGLEREGYPPISERDIHHMFVEAIVAGKPVPGQIYDITTGMRRFHAHAPTLNWHTDPRFSHLTRRDEGLEVDAARDGSQQQQSLKEQMDAAQTSAELVDVLVQVFIARLQSQLQLAEGSVTGDHSIAELGVDSLAAVDIRAWIWKALGLDVAVMKILSGLTIAKLCQEIAGPIMESRAGGRPRS
jgi:NAD(P)-dependent dehydrogenase (short-subunit alcohol dehydrogenase family)